MMHRTNEISTREKALIAVMKSGSTLDKLNPELKVHIPRQVDQ